MPAKYNIYADIFAGPPGSWTIRRPDYCKPPNAPATVSPVPRGHIRSLHRSSIKAQDLILKQVDDLLDDRTSTIELTDQVKLRSALVEGHSGAGKSSILLGHASDAEGPVVYFVDNQNHFKYLEAMLQTHLRPGEYHPNDLVFVSGQTLRANIYTQTDSHKPKIFFLTKHALRRSKEELAELCKKLKIKNFYYDDVSNLMYISQEELNGHPEAAAQISTFTHLLDLFAKTESSEALNLVGSINYSFHPKLHDEVHSTAYSDTIGRLFPFINEATRLDPSADGRIKQGLPYIDTVTADKRFHKIDFPEIGSIVEGLPTVEKILKKNAGNPDECQRIIDRIATQIANQGGKTIIRTSSPDAANIMQEALTRILKSQGKLNEGQEATMVRLSTNPNVQNGLKWFLDKDSRKYLITTNYFDQIHLPYGSFDNFFYLDAATSSIALAKELSLASSDPNVKIFYIRPLNAEAHQAYKFPDIEYRVPRHFGRKLERGIGEQKGIKPIYIKAIETGLEKVSIKDHRAWTQFLERASHILHIDKTDGERDLLTSAFVKNFIDKFNPVAGFKEDEVIDILWGLGQDKAETYKVFRAFVQFLFEGDGIPEKLRDWYKDTDADFKEVIGLKELNLSEMQRTYPNLMGVNNFEEARAVLRKLSAVYDFHLGLIDALSVGNSFSDREKIEVISGLLKYLNIDKAMLKLELGLKADELEQKLSEYFHAHGYQLNDMDLSQMADLVLDHKLICMLFPGLKIVETFAAKDQEGDKEMSIVINDQTVTINVCTKEGETKDANS